MSRSLDTHDLTICAVSFHGKRYLEMNFELVRRLNPSTRFIWIVAENTPLGSDNRIEPTQEILLIEGAEFDSTKQRPASYHHAIALNKAIRLVKTRFALVIDPDFYIVMENWATEVLEYMQVHQLAFWGVPWHPKWYAKYRYFPCAHCLFVDMNQIDRNELDFTPEDDGVVNGGVAHAKHFLPPLIRKVIGRLFLNRRWIGMSRDTGYRLYRQYGKQEEVKSECALPVFNPYHSLDGFRSVFSIYEKLGDKFLPDRFSYTPKHEGYFAERGFRELGYIDVRSRDWEEFLWKSQPFGFHVRGYIHGPRDLEDERVAIVSAIANLTGGVS